MCLACSYQIPEPQFNESDIVIPTIPRRVRRAPLSSVAASDSVLLSPIASVPTSGVASPGPGAGPIEELSAVPLHSGSPSSSSQTPLVAQLEGASACSASPEGPNRQALLKHFRQNYCKPVKLRHEHSTCPLPVVVADRIGPKKIYRTV